MTTYATKAIIGTVGLGIVGVIAHNVFVHRDIGDNNHYFDHLAFLGNNDPILGALILIGSVSVLVSAWLEGTQRTVQYRNVASTQELRRFRFNDPALYATCATTMLLSIAFYGLLVGGLSSFDVDMHGWVSSDMGLNPAHKPTDLHKSLYFIGYGLLLLATPLYQGYVSWAYDREEKNELPANNPQKKEYEPNILSDEGNRNLL